MTVLSPRVRRKLRDVPGELRFWRRRARCALDTALVVALLVMAAANALANDYAEASFDLLLVCVLVGGRRLDRVEKKLDKTADTQAALERVIDRMSKI